MDNKEITELQILTDEEWDNMLSEIDAEEQDEIREELAERQLFDEDLEDE
jgi:hypothetical protein